MIIWLSSYPRSGNTLLRTILKQTMGMGSYSDEKLPSSVGLSEYSIAKCGHKEFCESWESFYRRASSSDELFLVKTHLPPRDNQPTIYVIRDGRSSLISYRRYHETFFADAPIRLMDLVFGHDYYGGWSQHYRSWMTDTRKIIIIRYEELVNLSAETVKRIAAFIGYFGSVSEWNNPFVALHEDNPRFFREGKASWKEIPEWTGLVNQAFFFLHGDLMVSLGYSRQEEYEYTHRSIPPEVIQLIQTTCRIEQHRRELAHVCRERQDVINRLDAEVKKLSAFPFDLLCNLRSVKRMFARSENATK